MITLQFLRGTDFGAKAIEWFGHGADYSHVDTVMPDGRLYGARSDKVGGAPPGVQYRKSNYYYAKKELSMRITLDTTPEQDKAYYDFLLKQFNKPYDKMGILSFILGRNWDDLDSWFCSELVTAGLVNCGYFTYPLAVTSNKVAPADLILMLSVRQKIA